MFLDDEDLEKVTEFTMLDVDTVHLVGSAANSFSPLVAKSTAHGVEITIEHVPGWSAPATQLARRLEKASSTAHARRIVKAWAADVGARLEG
jgi:hypothetical protein